MPQIFPASADTTLRKAMVLLAAAVLGAGALAFAMARSDSAWGVGKPAPQPIPFSHALHAGGMDLDCRYCHAQAETTAGAGMPAAGLCLGCHDHVGTGAAAVAPLRDAAALGGVLEWRSVHRLPAHVRFHHAAHVAKGVDCGFCHGAVQEMPRTVKVETMSMGWCLDCHRDPTPALPADHHGLRRDGMTDCTTCHR
jgi:predicted CXXCH cytochrome family protein